MWTTSEAIQLCRDIEAFSPKHGMHVALTGGLLYKDGERKDCDLVLYRIRQTPLEDILWEEFALYLSNMGFSNFRHFGFCIKCDYKGKPVDILCPEPFVERDGGGYPVVPEPLHSEPMVAAVLEVQILES